jgi:hypothetical protein
MRICENRIVFASKQQGQERAAMERDFRLQKRSICPRIVLRRAEKTYHFARNRVGNGGGEHRNQRFPLKRTAVGRGKVRRIHAQ